MAMKINTEECLNYDFEVTINDGVTLVEFTDSHRHNLWSMLRMSQLTKFNPGLFMSPT
ncbi:hypothetical protein DFO68_104198 [Halomonas ventosae]|uniref:Uncharacterized protein n=1 Tax=Halomonas ventosae TaxID=229007 RepID=A0A4R6HWB5_9GAMM|nr:hypothetical protein DFO68_104198 [Halomonas ventosae]